MNLNLRKQDIDRRGKVWTSFIGGHKTEHHGHERRLYFGPEAQAVLAPFLVRPDDAYLFSPREAERERREVRRTHRRTPNGRGNEPGTNCVPEPKRKAGGPAHHCMSFPSAVAREVQVRHSPRG